PRSRRPRRPRTAMPTGWRRISRAVRGRARSLGSARGPACAEVGRDLQGSRPPGVLLTHLLDLDGERFQRAAVIAQLPQLPGDGLGAVVDLPAGSRRLDQLTG